MHSHHTAVAASRRLYLSKSYLLVLVVLRYSHPLPVLTGKSTRLCPIEITQWYHHHYRNLDSESVLIAPLVKNPNPKLKLNPKLNVLGSLGELAVTTDSDFSP
ncbi:hypothetical protein DEU56DRAFT_816840 [Suillus clintonianus]|uniref:uncharacterized protein n=1 Tax=Suillus clintonianus TaxID=1904413 RepID=UPI001B86C580|nr:uncharacterized protein DEU56DRAFT_816840 [Suillus clintonianus]KAG2129581.1 hypothetical protein DEU56DRAFT_816840 [Suillus clintonianus]